MEIQLNGPQARNVLLVVLLAALVAACGGGGDAPDAGEPPAARPPDPPASALPPAASPPPPAPAPAPTPVPVPSGASQTCSASATAAFRVEMLARVNAYRSAPRSCGARGTFAATTALAWSSQLEQAADGHSRDMATQNYFSHDSRDGRKFTQRIEAAGYRWRGAAENIAAGQSSVQAVVDGWIASDGHCANIMSPGMRDIGVACVPSTTAQYRSYWTMNLGAPR